jgi:hypothetical protein
MTSNPSGYPNRESISGAIPVDHIFLLAGVWLKSYEEYATWHAAAETELQRRLEWESAVPETSGIHETPGYCYLCKKKTQFASSFRNSIRYPNGKNTINWREQLRCRFCGMFSRWRASIHIFEQEFQPLASARIYMTEQTTALFQWVKEHYPHTCGSEFFGDSFAFGAYNANFVRNEDLTQLTYATEIFDSILSFDVFEHIPDYQQAFRECWRCLKRDGILMFSVPFSADSEKNLVRAVRDEAGRIQHILPPEIHGNPVSATGSLCYRYFGWEMLAELKQAGFRDSGAFLYWSEELGYMGWGKQFMFYAKK